MLAGVNMPNHVRSCWMKNEGWPICPKLTGDLPHGRGCLPWRQQVPTSIPWGAVQVWVNVPNHIQSCRPWMMHHPGQYKAGRPLNLASPKKSESGPICSKLTGDLSHGEGYLPWRWWFPTTIPPGAVQLWVNVPNHIRSCWPSTRHYLSAVFIKWQKICNLWLAKCNHTPDRFDRVKCYKKWYW